MDVREAFELVIDHGEVLAVGSEAEKLRVPGGHERDMSLELRCIHRMTELHGGDNLFQCGILQILIELLFADFGGKRLRLEVKGIIFHFDGPGEKSFARHFDGERGIHGPVGAGSELQLFVGEPGPLAGEFRGNLNALDLPEDRSLVEAGERRRGIFEIHRQRIDGRDALIVVRRELGRVDRVGNVVRSGTKLVPGEAAHGDRQKGRGGNDAPAIRRQIADGFAQQAPRPRDPPRRLPFHVSEDCAEQTHQRLNDAIRILGFRRASQRHASRLYVRNAKVIACYRIFFSI